MDITRILSVATIVTILYSVQATAQIIGEVQEDMRCVQKLMPCQPYIHSMIPPPPSCCTPMKEIVERDVTCLCDVFNHPGMLSFFDLTKENALNLLKSCGAKHDLSVCKTDSASATALSGSTSNGSNSASTEKNVALAVGLLVFSFVSFLGMTFL